MCLRSTYYSENIPSWLPCGPQLDFFFFFFFFFLWAMSWARLWKRYVYETWCWWPPTSPRATKKFRWSLSPSLILGNKVREWEIRHDSHGLHFGAHHPTHATVKSLQPREVISAEGKGERKRNLRGGMVILVPSSVLPQLQSLRGSTTGKGRRVRHPLSFT